MTTATRTPPPTLADLLKRAAVLVRERNAGRTTGLTAKELTRLFEELGMRAEAIYYAFAALRAAMPNIHATQGLSFWMEESTPDALADALEKATAHV